MSPASELPLPADVAQPTGFLHTLLTMSLTAVAVLRPLYDPTQTVIEDFAWVYLNAAGQRMLQQPERPEPSLLTLFPTAQADGVFDKCCLAYETGELQRNQTNYQADGLDGYFLLVAQRYDNVLVVNFTDTNDQPRTPVEQALRASQARERTALAEAERQQGTLQALLAQAPVAIALFQGPEVRVATVNEQMAALWGRTPAQVLGHPLVEGVPELRGQGFDDMIRAVQTTGKPYVGREEPATILQNGQLVVRYYNYSCQLIYDAAGEPLGVLNVGAEVTEQVEARRHLEVLNHELEARVQERTRQLVEQQQLLSQILSQVPAAVATLSGPTHRFSFFNEGYKLLTADRAQLGLRVAEALPEVVEQGFIELLDQVYTSGEPFYGREIAIILQRAGQAETTQYLDFTYQPLTDKQGQTQGILVFAIDVTAQVLARRQAATLQAAMLAVAQRQAQQRQELYQIFEQTPVAIVLLREPDHRIDYFNPAFRELFPPEQEHDSLQGHQVEEVYPRLKLAGLVRLLDDVFATGVSQTVLEMPLADLQPGSPRYITFAYQPYVEQDRIVGVAAFAYDATEQVLARQQVQRLNEQLAATNLGLNTANTQLTNANADLDTFIYTASHDLRMPVANLEGLLAALRQELLDEPIIKRDVEFIMGLMDDAIVRFQTTLRHLTGIIEQQAGRPATQLLDLAALVEEVRLDLTPLLAETQGELLVDVQACPTLHSSPKDVRSILLNLLSNALKYRAPDRPARVHLLATCDEQWAELRVQDNGLGLNAAQQSQLFGLFARLHDHVEGSGVGLYAIKRLIDNRGGTITVESTPGVGSTFRVRLPV